MARLINWELLSTYQSWMILQVAKERLVEALDNTVNRSTGRLGLGIYTFLVDWNGDVDLINKMWFHKEIEHEHVSLL